MHSKIAQGCPWGKHTSSCTLSCPSLAVDFSFWASSSCSQNQNEHRGQAFFPVMVTLMHGHLLL